MTPPACCARFAAAVLQYSNPVQAPACVRGAACAAVSLRSAAAAAAAACPAAGEVLTAAAAAGKACGELPVMLLRMNAARAPEVTASAGGETPARLSNRPHRASWTASILRKIAHSCSQHRERPSPATRFAAMAEDTQRAAAAAEQTAEQAGASQSDGPSASALEVHEVTGDVQQQDQQQQEQQQHDQQQQEQQQYAYDLQQQQQYFEQQQQYQQQQLSSDPSASERIKLFVGNFPPHITDLDLGAMCGQFAPIAGGPPVKRDV